MFDRRLIQHFDWVLLLLLVSICAISALNLYSATYPIRNAGGSQIFIKHIYWILVGFAVLLIMTTFNYHLLDRLAYPSYFFSIALLILVLLVGKATSGSQRWLSLGGISFQPSELIKITLIITLCKFFSAHGEERYEYRLGDLWKPFLITCLPCLLIIKEPDLGTAITLFFVAFSIILFSKIHWKSLLILIIACMVMVPFLWTTLKEYQQKRILTFINPEMDILGAGYHINQSKIAIGSGLLWGKGYLKGTQTRLHFLPEQHTDFAFSVFAEEWGFLGSVFLMILYLALILWGLNIARNSKDRFGSLLALGITGIVFWQWVTNVGMTTGLLPVVGVPLVLFSYGGSSFVSLMIGMGLLMNISMRRFMFT